MSALLTFPSQTTLAVEQHTAPDYMRPSLVPYAVSLEGALSAEECKEILKIEPMVAPYSAKGCGATTREIPFDPALDVIESVARNINRRYFGFHLDPGQHSWMQTYNPGGKYQRHMDGAPGQTRKLTAVVMLTNPAEYEGGTLKLYVRPKSFSVPKTLGTIVVFQHWVEHEVLPITSGKRQTINMGFWGPPFR